ncbi:RNA pyrophosphohydrolase [Actinomyces bovis]|uniref:RNA pyrophosphohydrolase n=1 Tax=Actinomyces bovis TaxID=1658 RepID=A0ABY1VRJ9_9ACTO|nr:NUDIX domain-containing protein [Actinomyces bovis]SPT54302.1 RNA pyrophosphohydrolase [Actinomyces bovis]VEG56349.1 RNA pyrophosphohydrolase [Actinomyces israelii]
MATPEFILSLRTKIGHDPLWLPGISLVVFDEAERVLLGRRSDNGLWAVISGIPEPGEQPVACALRECLEETGVHPEVLGLCGVVAGGEMAFPNGDRCTFMDINLVGRANQEQVAATHVGDEESTEVGWFAVDALPEPLADSSRGRIASAQAWLADPAAVRLGR